MQRRVHVLVVTIVVLLALSGWASSSVTPSVSPARAQEEISFLTPPVFPNLQGVIGSHRSCNPTDEDDPPIFAITDVADPEAFPTSTVRVQNFEGCSGAQRLWLSVRVSENNSGVRVDPENGYAEMDLIAPGGYAEYTLTFPESSGSVEFEVDGSTSEAALLTILQFALDSGFAAADLTGLGSYEQEIGLEVAQIVAEQYLADLPTLVPCKNAVVAVQRGVDDQDQFMADLQGCLESQMWQNTIPQVLERVAERDWFQQALTVARKTRPEVELAFKGVKATELATRVFTMLDTFHPEIPGAMVGTVSFMAIDTTVSDTLGAATAAPETLSDGHQIMAHALEAIKRAGTFRFQFVGSDPPPFSGSGEASFNQEAGSFVSTDSKTKWYSVGEDIYSSDANFGGVWSRTSQGYPMGLDGDLTEVVLGRDWQFQDIVTSDGETRYIVRDHSIGAEFWIDATTSLPVRWILDDVGYADFSDFGAPVSVEVPAAVLRVLQPMDTSAAEFTVGRIWMEVVEALNQAGTFRFQEYDDRGLIATGGVDLLRQAARYSRTEQAAEYPLEQDEFVSLTYIDNVLSGAGTDGAFSVDSQWDELYGYFTGMTDPNTLTFREIDPGNLTVRESENRTWYVFDIFPWVFWVDSETYLPGKLVLSGPHGHREFVLSDFGTPVDVEVPRPESLTTTQNTIGPWQVTPISVGNAPYREGIVVPEGFKRIEVVFAIKNRSSEPIGTYSEWTHGRTTEGVVRFRGSGSEILGQITAPGGFTYGLDGKPGPTSGGRFSGGGAVPPGYQLPFYLTLDIPESATDLAVDLIDGSTGDSVSFPLDSIPTNAAIDPGVYPAEGLLQIGDSVDHGPLTITVTDATLTKTLADDRKALWDMDVTVRTENAYGYALSPALRFMAFDPEGRVYADSWGGHPNSYF
jgi:hypothetical protein